MTRIKAVLSTTHVDLQNMKLTKQALESLATQINGSQAVPCNVGHDLTLPPVGKWSKAWVEPTDDGEFQIVGWLDLFDEPEEAWLPDGAMVVEQANVMDTRPFTVASFEKPSDETVIRYDVGNFESQETLNAFLDAVRSTGDVRLQSLVRKAWMADPTLLITLAQGFGMILGATTVYKVADKLSEKIAEDIASLYLALRAAATGIARYAVPKNRPITYVFTLPGNPTVEFAARSADVDSVLSAIFERKLEEPLRTAYDIGTSLRAVKVQFLLNVDGIWEFNCLLTDTGSVAGTPESFSRRARLEKLTAGKGVSIASSSELAAPLDFDLTEDSE